MKVPWPSASLESLPTIIWSLARGYRLAYRWRANEGGKDERILSYTESWNAIACRKLNIDFPSAGSQGLRPLGLWIGLHLKSWNNSESMRRDNLTHRVAVRFLTIVLGIWRLLMSRVKSVLLVSPKLQYSFLEVFRSLSLVSKNLVAKNLFCLNPDVISNSFFFCKQPITPMFSFVQLLMSACL